MKTSGPVSDETSDETSDSASYSLAESFVEFCDNCSDVSLVSFLALVLKKPPQGQVKEEKLVPSSVGSEHLDGVKA